MTTVEVVLAIGGYAVFGACLFCGCLLAWVRNEKRIGND